MADEQKKPEGEDELVLTEDDQLNPDDEGEDQRGDEEDDDPDPNVNDQDEEEEVLTFGDDAEPEDNDTNLVKHLRDQIRKRDKELAEARRSAPQEQPIEVGEKPTLAGCEYDEEAYEQQLDAWKERKAEAEKQTTERTKASEDEMKAWQQELSEVEQEKAQLSRPDADEAFDTVRAALTPAQQSALVKAADKGNRAKLIYALAKNSERLTQLASETDLVRFIKEVTKLEGSLKMVKRRKAPDPDTPQRGSASPSAVTADKRLEKLEKEAVRTGDRTKLIAYKKTLNK